MIKLELFTEVDFDRFISWIDNEEFMYQFAGPAFTFPITKEQLYNYISEQNRKVYKAVDVETGKTIGHGEINKIDTRNKSARICRMLVANEAERNKGYGAQLVNALLKIGFDGLDLHRIDLGVFEFNKGAIKCYEKCGLKIEGLLRESFRIGTEFHSIYNMSILRNEWSDKITCNH